MNITVGKQAIAEATAKLKNWGRWGADDQIGTLNHIRPEDIVRAAGLIRRGQVFALGIPLDRTGPQTGLFGGRWNPIHTMLATGTDAVAGRQDVVPNIRYADDAMWASWEALSEMGNLSSSSVLMVLEKTMNKRPAPGTWSILAAMGPAFCSELILLRW